MNDQLKFTNIGGPTALLELDGLRLLTDPTFDPAGTEYPTGLYTLRKDVGPAISPEILGHIDAVLLSHDHHFDNLDHAGRALLGNVEIILTTLSGAERLGIGFLFADNSWIPSDLEWGAHSAFKRTLVPGSCDRSGFVRRIWANRKTLI